MGTLAYRDRKVFFEYNSAFIVSGLEISPFNLPLSLGTSLQVFDPLDLRALDGLAGVFHDSLPDGWGRRLLDCKLGSEAVNASRITPLDRLAHIGASGIGALVYKPAKEGGGNAKLLDLDSLAASCQQVLQDKDVAEVIADLLELGGFAGGARPKAVISVSKDKKVVLSEQQQGYEPWLVKFPSSHIEYDGIDAGAIEYVYALMARKAGLQMEDVHLFPATKGPGYFATKRFDRTADGRLHFHSVAGLLHADFRLPMLDYAALLAWTLELTKDVREVQKLFRQAVFNVLARNRDDHAKNFSFVMDASGTWLLSPAYDLTFSSGPSGEHCTTVLGEGRNPTADHLVKLGQKAGLSQKLIQEIIEQTRDALSLWPKLAKDNSVRGRIIKQIGSQINQT